MAKRSNKNISQHPSLFDIDAPTSMPSLPGIDSFPVHPAIERHVVKVRMESAARQQAAQPSPFDELREVKRKKPLMFMSFGSGSSGNCSYVGNGDCGLLIDAGVDPKHVENTLLRNGIGMDTIAGICLTHDHSDHIHFAYCLLRKHKHVRLYCTPKALNGILRRHSVSKRIRDYHTPIYKEFPFKVGPFQLTAFEVNHDGTDNAGYHIQYADTHFTIATDLGSITDRVEHYMRLSRHIVIESNYDDEMLTNGTYAEYLKARIRSEHGHLGNHETAAFIAELSRGDLANVFLCHLSNDNNTPALALAASRDALVAAGVESIGDGSRSLESEKASLQLATLPRYEASPLYILD